MENPNMESVLIPGKLEADELLQVFYKATNRVDYKNMHTGPDSEVVIITCDKPFLRLRRYVGFVLVSFFDGTDTRIDYGIVGMGSSNILNGIKAANQSFDEITRGLSDLLNARGGKPAGGQ